MPANIPATMINNVTQVTAFLTFVFIITSLLLNKFIIKVRLCKYTFLGETIENLKTLLQTKEIFSIIY